MAQPSVFEQILDYANRANPYPLYAELRKTPVARQEDGSYVVSTYREIVALLHDPRVSSDVRNLADAGGRRRRGRGSPPELHPPRPARARPAPAPGDAALRPARTRPAGSTAWRPSCSSIVTGLIDGFAGRTAGRHRRRLRLPVPGHGDLRAARGAPRGRAALPRLGRSGRRGPRPDERRAAEQQQRRAQASAELGAVPRRAGRGPPPDTGRRPALRAGHRRRPRRADVPGASC